MMTRGAACRPEPHSLADAVATMIQALRTGDSVKARTVGLVALASYADDHPGMSVERLLERGNTVDVSPSPLILAVASAY